MREFSRRTLRHWGFFVSGAIASLAAWVLMGSGIQTLPVILLVSVGSVLLVCAMARTFHDVRIQRDQYVERLTPVFELTDNEPACYQTDENEEQGRFQTRKVMVRNGGGTSIDDVKVSLVSIDPDDQGLTEIMPLTLRPQHMNDKRPDYGFSLAPGEGRPVGVFGVNSRIPDFILYHVVDGVRNVIRGLEGDSYRVHIRVTGRDVPPVTRVARIGIDDDRNPTLKLLD